MSTTLSEQDWHEIFERVSENVAAAYAAAAAAQLHEDVSRARRALIATSQREQQLRAELDEYKVWQEAYNAQTLRLDAELDASQKAVDDFRNFITTTEMDIDIAGRIYCRICDNYGEHTNDCPLGILLAAHPEKEQKMITTNSSEWKQIALEVGRLYHINLTAERRINWIADYIVRLLNEREASQQPARCQHNWQIITADLAVCRFCGERH